jgi:hypothetical protein
MDRKPTQIGFYSFRSGGWGRANRYVRGSCDKIGDSNLISTAASLGSPACDDGHSKGCLGSLSSPGEGMCRGRFWARPGEAEVGCSSADDNDENWVDSDLERELGSPPIWPTMSDLPGSFI